MKRATDYIKWKKDEVGRVETSINDLKAKLNSASGDKKAQISADLAGLSKRAEDLKGSFTQALGGGLTDKAIEGMSGEQIGLMLGLMQAAGTRDQIVSMREEMAGAKGDLAKTRTEVGKIDGGKALGEAYLKTATDYIKWKKDEVGRVEKKERHLYPHPPFKTSTLQQAAANVLGWSAKKTMAVAQRPF